MITTGIKKLDEQHSALIELATQVRVDTDVALVRVHYAQLIRLIRVHFKAEERVLAEVKFCGLKSHAATHSKLLALLLRVNRELSQATDIPPTVASSIAALKAHIKNDDVKYARYFDRVSSVKLNGVRSITPADVKSYKRQVKLLLDCVV